MMRDIPVHRIVEGLLFHRLKMRPMGFLAFKLLGSVADRRLWPCAALDRLEPRRNGPPPGRPRRPDRTERGGMDHRIRVHSGRRELGGHLRAAARSVLGGAPPTPGLQAYWSLLRARPSYNEAMTAHRHPFVSAGADRIREEIARAEAIWRPCTRFSWRRR